MEYILTIDAEKFRSTNAPWNAPYIQKARNANKHKNQEYFKKFGVQVYDVISDSKGNIVNPDVLKNL